MPQLLSNDFMKDLPEITTSKYFEKKKRYHKDGLFSEYIFGLENNYTCHCGIYHGKSAEGTVCNEKCCNGLPITHSIKRRRQYAKIILPIPVLNKTFLLLLKKVFPNEKIVEAITKIMKSYKNIIYKKDGEYFLRELGENEDLDKFELEYYSLHEAAEIYLKETIEKYRLIDPENKQFKMIDDNKDKLFINEILVIPPDFRPISQINANTKSVDQINQYYNQLLVRKEIMAKIDMDITQHIKIYHNYYIQFQYIYNELYEYIIQKISKKEGLIRGNILGKRIDFSGRAVIAPSPNINLDECILPYKMVLELYKIKIAKYLYNSGKFKFLNQALLCVEECQFYNDPRLLDICKKIIGDDVCILNRQPSLHKLSFMAFKIKVDIVDVIYIHPMVCHGFNADFDGDAMAVYLPITPESQEEAKRQALSTKMLINPTNMQIITLPSQEMILGLYLLSVAKDGKYGQKCEFKNVEMTYGMALINKCFPKDYKVITEKITTKSISSIIYEIFNKHPDEIVEVLDKIKTTGFKYATLIGHTISLKGMTSNEKLKNEIYSKKTSQQQLKAITSNKVKKYLQENFIYTDMIESGARGSWDQARQLILTRGFVSNFKGTILPIPVKNCLVDGLTPTEFFLSSYGCRKGLLDIAIKTASSGYLFRKFLFACSNLMIDYENEDCGTTDLLGVYINDLKKAYSVKGRWYAPDPEKPTELELITDANLNNIINKRIFIRSPIFCKTKKLCKTCYGKLYEYLNNSRFVGSIAAQSLGESNTQMVLRTFHTSGVAITKNKDVTENETENKKMKQDDIVGALTLISQLVHKFDSSVTCDILVEQLHHIYSDGRFFMLIHFECLVAQLMWSARKKWRLLPNRDKVSYELNSIVAVPSLESWLMGLAFSNTKRELINGLLEPGLYSGGVIDKILCGVSYKDI